MILPTMMPVGSGQDLRRGREGFKLYLMSHLPSFIHLAKILHRMHGSRDVVRKVGKTSMALRCISFEATAIAVGISAYDHAK